MKEMCPFSDETDESDQKWPESDQSDQSDEIPVLLLLLATMRLLMKRKMHLLTFVCYVYDGKKIS